MQSNNDDEDDDDYNGNDNNDGDLYEVFNLLIGHGSLIC